MEDINHEHLILQFLSGSISEKERASLFAWIEESPEHKKEFEELQKVWQMTHSSSKSLDFETGLEWKRLNTQLNEIETGASQKERPFYKKLPVWKIAASVSLLMVSLLSLYLMFVQHQEIQIATGNLKQEILLPDGSVVLLNKESRIAYEKRFKGEKRIVTLQGEAFFEVVKNPEKPFVVVTDNATVEVLGTSFNVKAYHRAAKEVYVETGKVNFASEKESLILNPGEKGILDKQQQLSLLKVSNENELAWKTNKLKFQKTPLKDVLADLEAYFNIRISVKEPDLLKCRFTSSFENPDLEEVLEVLKISLKLKVRQDKNVFTIDGKGC